MWCKIIHISGITKVNIILNYTCECKVGRCSITMAMMLARFLALLSPSPFILLWVEAKWGSECMHVVAYTLSNRNGIKNKLQNFVSVQYCHSTYSAHSASLLSVSPRAGGRYGAHTSSLSLRSLSPFALSRIHYSMSRKRPIGTAWE